MKDERITKISDSLESTEGLPIRYDVYSLADQEPAANPTILFLHGFKGFKDWGTFPAVCERMATAGFAVVAMNFSLNGIGENPLEFDRLDLFGRETLSQDLNDVGSVLKGIRQGEVTADGQSLNGKNVGILGHSRGGQTAVAAAAEYPAITCLVTWSAVADYNARWSEQQIADWKSVGVTEIKNGRTGQIMPMKKVVWDDARENADRVIALNRVDELNIPALFIHSRGDDAVPYEDARQLYGACVSEEKELFLLLTEGGGHTFGGSHPFEAEEFPQQLEQAVEKSIGWFVDHLK